MKDEKITNTRFLLTIEELRDSFVLYFTTGRPDQNDGGCEGCGTLEDRPGFFDPGNDEWMCAVCTFDPRSDGKIVPIEIDT